MPNYQEKERRGNYTEREKRAYSAGCGYAAGKAGERVACKTEDEKTSFRNGVNATRQRMREKAKKTGGRRR